MDLLGAYGVEATSSRFESYEVRVDREVVSFERAHDLKKTRYLQALLRVYLIERQERFQYRDFVYVLLEPKEILFAVS